jgi:small-conductance mechanosensitive channel
MTKPPPSTTMLSLFQRPFAEMLPGIALLVGGGLAIWLVVRLLDRALYRRTRHLKLSEQVTRTVRKVVVASLWTVLLLVVLHTWGVNVSGVWAMLASLLAVIGVGMLAVWTMISNVTAALFIWIWRPYTMGQHIEVLPDGFKGRVVDRNLMFTELEDADGSTLVIPNNLFFQRVTRRAPNGHVHTERPQAVDATR